MRERRANRRFAPVSLLGATVEVQLALHDGTWMVVQDDGGPSVRVQRPEDFRARWVDRKFIKVIFNPQAPNAELSNRGRE